jgi:hypothetical protein
VSELHKIMHNLAFAGLLGLIAYIVLTWKPPAPLLLGVTVTLFAFCAVSPRS